MNQKEFDEAVIDAQTWLDELWQEVMDEWTRPYQRAEGWEEEEDGEGPWQDENLFRENWRQPV